jgi:hypothetical protein
VFESLEQMHGEISMDQYGMVQMDNEERPPDEL